MTMNEIDWIFGNKTNKVKKSVKDPLAGLFDVKPISKVKPKPVVSLFKGQGHPNPKDRITKQQGMFLKKTRVGSGMSHMRFWDSDGDGVINGLDCMPRNPKRHMKGQYGCRQCQCGPEDENCNCLCHEGSDFNTSIRDEYKQKVERGVIPIVDANRILVNLGEIPLSNQGLLNRSPLDEMSKEEIDELEEQYRRAAEQEAREYESRGN